MKHSRELTKKIKIGTTYIGGSNNVLIQSMCDIKTSNYKEVINQINECQKAGADLMRISILDENDIKAIKIIKSKTNIPLIADIHYASKFAIKAIENGIDKIRINPINTPKNELLKIIQSAKKYNVPIRIGINEGSIDSRGNAISTIKGLINLCLETINFFEENNFFNLVISVKSSDPLKTYKIYKKLSKLTNYPLHIGITESGFDYIGIIRSTIGLAPLLQEGIGNTIRISLTKNPILEIKTAKRLLHDLNLYKNYPTIISCPTCGRCKVNNLDVIVKKITDFLEIKNYNIKISIMGCIVNGIGESKSSDYGIAGENKTFILLKKGKIVKKVKEENIISELEKLIISDFENHSSN